MDKLELAYAMAKFERGLPLDLFNLLMSELVQDEEGLSFLTVAREAVAEEVEAQAAQTFFNSDDDDYDDDSDYNDDDDDYNDDDYDDDDDDDDGGSQAVVDVPFDHPFAQGWDLPGEVVTESNEDGDGEDDDEPEDEDE